MWHSIFERSLVSDSVIVVEQFSFALLFIVRIRSLVSKLRLVKINAVSMFLSVNKLSFVSSLRIDKLAFAFELPILVERSFINVWMTLILPPHDSLLFLTVFIKSLEAIILRGYFLFSFSVKLIIFEFAWVLKIFGYKITIFTFSLIVFHDTFEKWSVFKNIEARSLSLTANKIADKECSVLLIHFSYFCRPSDLNKDKITISVGPS